MVRDRKSSKAGEQRWTQVQRGFGAVCRAGPLPFGLGAFSLLFLGWSVEPSESDGARGGFRWSRAGCDSFC